MEKHEQRHSSGLSSGFLLGVVVGVVITLLLTTKRGKKILKMITEEGMSKLTNWEDILTDIAEDKAQSQETKQPEVSMMVEDEDGVQLEPAEEEKKTEEKEEIAKPIKRFFKGIPRRSIHLL